MAETRVMIDIGNLPSQLKDAVHEFVDDGRLSVEDQSGFFFAVSISKDKLFLTPQYSSTLLTVDMRKKNIVDCEHRMCRDIGSRLTIDEPW